MPLDFVSQNPPLEGREHGHPKPQAGKWRQLSPLSRIDEIAWIAAMTAIRAVGTVPDFTETFQSKNMTCQNLKNYPETFPTAAKTNTCETTNCCSPEMNQNRYVARMTEIRCSGWFRIFCDTGWEVSKAIPHHKQVLKSSLPYFKNYRKTFVDFTL